MNEYKICKRCIMDTSDKTIKFDEQGICNHCKQAEYLLNKYGYQGKESKEQLKEIVRKIKRDCKNQKYDCIIGVSGGVDSAYVLYMAHKFGLRILAVHIDDGWNSNIAVTNIHKLCEKMDIDLKTVVIDWNQFKELHRAFMLSGVPNLDVPQDHVFFASLYKFAIKYHIKYMLAGGNFATESILPQYLVYGALDYTYIKDIYRKHGRRKSIRRLPHATYLQQLYYRYKLKIVRPLDYIPYSKKMAINTLTKEFDWQYYGGKHWESRFTKFLQGYYLERKYGFNKSRAHLSNLIVNGEITRAEALYELEKENISYPMKEREKDCRYILKKLDISEKEWEGVMNLPNKSEDEYKNHKYIYSWINRIINTKFGSNIKNKLSKSL